MAFQRLRMLQVLCLLYAALWCSCHHESTPAVVSDKYVVFSANYSATHECSCETLNDSDYDFMCRIYNKSASNDHLLPCDDLPTVIVAHLTIDCSDCYECVVVNLYELTKAHFSNISDMKIYPPPEVHIFRCQIDSLSVGPNQLSNDHVNLSDDMQVAPFGVPEKPGIGGYYTVNVKYPKNFNESDCWLTYLRISNTNLWFLPTYILHKCMRLRSIGIYDSPITWVAMSDLLALRGVNTLILGNCRVDTFANDAVQVALDSLDEFLQHGNCSFPQSNATIETLRQMRYNSGRLNMVNFLYDSMDRAGLDFALLLGYRFSQEDDQSHDADIPHGVGLNMLNLAHNGLTEIPYSISMFGYLTTIDLSYNKISSLYRSWLCWYPPIPDSDKANSSRHCYWFRGSRQTLKVLDLSYNQIDMIGEIQPWHGVALAELYLQNNRILKINPDAFSYSMLTKSLLVLVLDDNPLPYFLLFNLTRLENLSIANSIVANIEPVSLPNSPHLTKLNLFNNSINDVAPHVFIHLEALESIDLRNNSMMHFYADSFLMPSRPTLGSRVVLYIGGQKVSPVCDCNHVYAKILSEESGMQRDNYSYPRLENDSLQSDCRFFSIDKGTVEHKRLNESHYKDFVCEFHGDEQHKIPENYCNKDNSSSNDSGYSVSCWVTCLTDCKCYHTQNWELANLNCSTTNIDLVRFTLTYPMKYIDMANIHGSNYFRRISAGTFKWKSPELSSVLLVLNLHNSNVYSIEDTAFNFKPPLIVLTLHDNQIKTVSADALCPLGNTLQALTLHSNELSSLDSEILSSSCLPSLINLSLKDNPWQCTCDSDWLKLHNALINVSRTTQAVSDYSEMRCTIDQSIVDACEHNKKTSAEWPECTSVLNNAWSRNYSVSDDGHLLSLCSKIADSESEYRRQVVVSAVGAAFGLLLLALVCLAIRRRHRLLAVVRVLVLLRYQRERRLSQQMSRDSIRYDAMLWAADRDQDRLVHVLNRVRSVSGGEELELCVPQSFLYSSLCSCPLTYFDCPAEGAKYSGKVVVALSERFLDTEYLALCQVIRELVSLGRSPFRDIIFLRLSQDVSLSRHRRRHPEDVEAFKALQRILANSDIVFESVDWEYRLVRLIRSGGGATVGTATDGTLLGDSGDQSSESVTMPDLPSDEQPLILDVEPVRQRSIVRTSDWPPFYSDQVAELFIISSTAADSAADQSSASTATKTITDQIVSRMSGVRLGTSDPVLADNWPDNFESAATAADQINSYMMKRTRQFVLLLSNRVLSWLRDEAELQCEFEAFLAGNTFRRRLLVILVGQVDARSRLRYQALANQRLGDDAESGETPNWWDLTADGDCDGLGSWLDQVLYKRRA